MFVSDDDVDIDGCGDNGDCDTLAVMTAVTTLVMVTAVREPRGGDECINSDSGGDRSAGGIISDDDGGDSDGGGDRSDGAMSAMMNTLTVPRRR